MTLAHDDKDAECGGEVGRAVNERDDLWHRRIIHLERENDLLRATNQRLMREAEEDRRAIRWLKARCVSYSEAVTILDECDHGDERTCGCRDKAAAITVEMPRG